MTTVLETDGATGVVYRIMTREDAVAATEAVAQAFFAGEPVVTRGGGATLRDMRAFCAMWVPRMAEEGNTVLAIDGETGSILGAFLNEDFSNVDPPGYDAFMESCDGVWAPCMNMIDELEGALCARYSIPKTGRQPGRWFHLWMIGVLPAGRGKGIAKKLASHSLAWARSRGFEVAFAECTGSGSTHIMETLGAETIAYCDYATWGEGAEGETLRGLPAMGHPGMSMKVRAL